jgi:hypothetical protein
VCYFSSCSFFALYGEVYVRLMGLSWFCFIFLFFFGAHLLINFVNVHDGDVPLLVPRIFSFGFGFVHGDRAFGVMWCASGRASVHTTGPW